VGCCVTYRVLIFAAGRPAPGVKLGKECRRFRIVLLRPRQGKRGQHAQRDRDKQHNEPTAQRGRRRKPLPEEAHGFHLASPANPGLG
jgi:hypothetical protein